MKINDLTRFLKLTSKLLKDKWSFLKERTVFKISIYKTEKNFKKDFVWLNFTLYLHPQSGKGD